MKTERIALPTVSESWQSLPDAVAYHAQAHGEKPAYIYVPPRSAPLPAMTFHELHLTARSIAATLVQRHDLRGKKVLLLYPPGLEFIHALFGCLYANLSVIPMYAPVRNTPDSRLRAIVATVDVAAILTTAAKEQSIRAMAEELLPAARCEVICTDRLPTSNAVDFEATIDPSIPALIQFTSGSTSNPKGVVVTHGNIMANQRMIRQAFGHRGGEVVVSWLPFFHDMGLIGNIMQPAFIGGCSILMSPPDFLQNPLKWLQLISAYKADTSGAPNFAYDYCAARISEEQMQELDLTSWKLAYNGSEMVRTATMQRFSRKFSRCGFDPQSVLYCYGLAEATLYVSSRKAFGCKYQALGPDIESLACVGPVPEGTLVRVVDAEGNALPEGATGEIWVSGPHIAQGYINDPVTTQSTFRAKVNNETDVAYMRTGDLGYLHEGQLHIVGRLKNVIVVNGRNYYGEEIEYFVSHSEEFFSESGACIVQMNEGLAANEIVFLQEIKKDYYEVAKNEITRLETRANEIRREVLNRFNLSVHRLVYLRENRLPRTSSGKIDRASTRRAVSSGEIPSLLEVDTR